MCSGAFLLAAAGLLDGRRATTHWARAERLAAEHPAVDVDADPIWTRDGNVWTSAGVTAGIDVALALVEDDHGVDVAETCARWLVMFLRRPGTQSQFAAPVWRDRARDEPIRRAQELIEADPAADHRLGVLARRVALSERHLLRRFTAELGITPARYVADVRVDAARRELEDGPTTPSPRSPPASASARPSRCAARSCATSAPRPTTTADDSPTTERTTPHDRASPSPCSPASPPSTASGPYEVLQRLPGYDVTFVGHERGPVRSDNGFLGIEIDATFDELPHPDVVVFPGGVGTRPLVQDERVLDWVRTAHETTTFTTSVCTGSLVLAAAGLLDGLTATTHWSAMDYLSKLGAVPTDERVVEHLDQRIITAAGVSSGIDMALRLVELLVDATAARGLPADDRVRPAAAVRRRLRRQGRRRRDGSRRRVLGRPRVATSQTASSACGHPHDELTDPGRAQPAS